MTQNAVRRFALKHNAQNAVRPFAREKTLRSGEHIIMKKTTKIVLKAATRYAMKTAKEVAVRRAAKAVREYAGASDKSADRGSGATLHELEGAVVLRSMTEADRGAVTELMRAFYASDAVLTAGSDEIFNNDISACVSDNPYLEGYVFTVTGQPGDEAGDNGPSANAEEIVGYAMIAHSFSTEYGKPCIWIEDIYLREEARGLGLASKFFEFLKSEYPNALHRLESERGNLRAMEFYKRKDFSEMPYVELFRDPE